MQCTIEYSTMHGLPYNTGGYDPTCYGTIRTIVVQGLETLCTWSACQQPGTVPTLVMQLSDVASISLTRLLLALVRQPFPQRAVISTVFQNAHLQRPKSIQYVWNITYTCLKAAAAPGRAELKPPIPGGIWLDWACSCDCVGFMSVEDVIRARFRTQVQPSLRGFNISLLNAEVGSSMLFGQPSSSNNGKKTRQL